MKFKKKMSLMIILKVTKKQGFTLFLENTVLEKPHGRRESTSLFSAKLSCKLQRYQMACLMILKIVIAITLQNFSGEWANLLNILHSALSIEKMKREY